MLDIFQIVKIVLWQLNVQKNVAKYEFCNKKKKYCIFKQLHYLKVDILKCYQSSYSTDYRQLTIF
jgi:hypothetical protein